MNKKKRPFERAIFAVITLGEAIATLREISSGVSFAMDIISKFSKWVNGVSRAGIVPPSFFVKNFKKELTLYKPWYIIYTERRCTINGENKKEPEIKRDDHRNQSSNLQAHNNHREARGLTPPLSTILSKPT